MHSRHDIFDRDSTMQELQNLQGRIGHGAAAIFVVINLREEARGAQYEHGQARFLMNQLAKIFPGAFGDPVDVLMNRGEGFRDPHRGIPRLRAHRSPKNAGRADVDEGADARFCRFF